MMKNDGVSCALSIFNPTLIRISVDTDKLNTGLPTFTVYSTNIINWEPILNFQTLVALTPTVMSILLILE